MPTSDCDLVAAARTGDREAFAELARRHRGVVVATAARTTGDRSLAEDVFQEALVVAWTNLDRLRRPASFGSWLVGIALNVCREWRRYQARAAWAAEAVLGGVRIRDATWEPNRPTCWSTESCWIGCASDPRASYRPAAGHHRLLLRGANPARDRSRAGDERGCGHYPALNCRWSGSSINSWLRLWIWKKQSPSS